MESTEKKCEHDDIRLKDKEIAEERIKVMKERMQYLIDAADKSQWGQTDCEHQNQHPWMILQTH